MIQPKYDPKESLERIKLMMNYDSSKTLNENKKSVSILTEADDDSSGGLGNAGSYAAGLTTPSLYRAGKRALGFGKDAAAKKAAEEAAKETGETLVKKGSIPWLSRLLGIGGGADTAAAATVTGAEAGAGAGAGAIAMGALPWVAGAAAIAATGYWLYDSYTNGLPTAEKVKKFFEGCSAQDKNLKSTKTDGELTAAAEKIKKATGGLLGLGTDEKAIKEALASMSTPADLCGLKDKYDFKYGNLYEDLDGDIDGSDWQTYVWAPMSVIIEKSINDIKKTITQPENPPAVPVPAAPAAPVDDNSGEEQIDGETPDDILNQ